MLDATESLLDDKQRERRLALLNAADDRLLDVEWEVAFLVALSALGHVSYEPTMKGSSRPDLHFACNTLEFIADIATVNDSAYLAANPVDAFEKELWRRVLKAGLRTDWFRYHIEDDSRGAKTRLLLPRNRRWQDLFDASFEAFLSSAQTRPDQQDHIRRQGPDFDVSFWYTAGRGASGGGHACFRFSRSDTKNPIFNALKRKRDQMKASAYEGRLGIILCDGDCEQLRFSERIVQRFLRSSTSIDFVVVTTLNGDRFSRREQPIRVSPRCFVSPLVSDLEKRQLVALFEHDIPPRMPTPCDDVKNALNHLRWKGRRVGLGHHGGWQFLGGNRGYMRISSRVLQELLAGAITFDEFMRIHRFGTQPTNDFNPFEYFLRRGSMISNIRLEASSDEDDDWVVFEFGGPDPAISNFVSKEAAQDKS